LNCTPRHRSAKNGGHNRKTSDGRQQIRKPINSQVSAYLQRPLRILKKAEQDNDAARHTMSMSSAEHGRGDSEMDHQVRQFPEPGRETPASTEKADWKR
jgi:hypothetical protein